MPEKDKYYEASYQDWLNRRHRLNGEIMHYKRYQREQFFKFVAYSIAILSFIYLIFIH